MVKFSDTIYHNFLKKGAIVLVILGIIISIFAVSYTISWIKGIGDISQTSLKTCSENVDCFEWCGDCVSVRNAIPCESTGINCSCISKTCQQT